MNKYIYIYNNIKYICICNNIKYINILLCKCRVNN